MKDCTPMIGRQKHLEKTCLTEMQPAFSLDIPDVMQAPLIFASPHSGRCYPIALQEMSRLTLHELRRNEDVYIDKLFATAPHHGVAQLTANFPRSFVDVNRAPDELPQDMMPDDYVPTARAKVGLGIVPLIIAENKPIYNKAPKLGAIKARIAALYTPYHTALTDILAGIHAEYGRALLIDCHSMPGFAPMGARRSDIILGDRYGISCAPETINRVEAAFQTRGYSVTRNYPYAGGYVTTHYSDRKRGIETLQIEINRDLYLNPVTLHLKNGFETLAADIDAIIADLITANKTPTALVAQ